MIDLRQKSIVVTGGASGIGAAICTAACEEGAAVGIIDIDGDAAVSLCRKLGPRAWCASGLLSSSLIARSIYLRPPPIPPTPSTPPSPL